MMPEDKLNWPETVEVEWWMRSGVSPYRILDALQAKIFVLDAEANILYVNRVAADFFRSVGLGEALVGQNYLTLCQEEWNQRSPDGQRAAAGILQVLAGELPRFEMEYICPFLEEERWYHMEVNRLPETMLSRDEEAASSNNAAVPQLLVVHEDITEAKQAQQQLAYQAGLLEDISDAVVSTDMEFIIRSWNRAAERIYGWKAEEAIGRSAREISPPVFLNTTPEHVREQFRQQGHWSGEVMQKRKDGQEVYIFASVSLSRDDAGHPVGIVAVNRDITHLKQTQKELQLSEEKYRQIFEQSHDVIYMSTPSGKLVDINPAGVELFGYDSREELLGVDVARDLYKNPRDREKLTQLLAEHGKVKDFEVVLKRKDGRELTVLNSAWAVTDAEGNIMAYRGILRDITERKRLEQQLMQAQKMEAIGTLAGGIAHDFNNILTGLLGYTEISLEETPPDSSVHAHLLAIRAAALRARDLVKQILTFSRQTPGEKKPLRMAQVVQEAVKLLRGMLPSSISITLSIEAESAVVEADPTQIHQVIMNLASNAYYAMKDTGGELGISLSEVEVDHRFTQGHLQHLQLSPGRYVQLTISDTGYGMDEETLERIFDPFFTTKPVGEGTGMGLAVVHGIVRSHRGAISVDSKVGEGSRFSIYLPLLHVSEEEIPSESPMALPGGSEHLLLVDDEEMLRAMYQRMLRRLGYRVTLAENGEEALKLLRDNPDQFDLVIVDQVMPGMTGLDLAQEIRQLRPEIPILLMTGFTEPAIMEKARRLAIPEYLNKPILMTDMARSIRRLLDQFSVRPTRGARKHSGKVKT